MKRSVAGLTLVPAGIIAVIITAGAAHAAGTSAAAPTAAYPPPVPSTSLSTSVLGTQYTAGPATDPALPGTSSTGTAGSLPFTGADIVGTTVVGIALIGGGATAVVAGRRRRGGSHR